MACCGQCYCVRVGAGISTTCGKCGCEREYLLGIGMRYRDSLDVLDLVPRRMREEVREDLEWKGWLGKEFRHEIMKCLECDRRYGRFWFLIVAPERDEPVEPGYVCGHCRATLVVEEDPGDLHIDESIVHWRCTRCGETGLRIGLMGCWD